MILGGFFIVLAFSAAIVNGWFFGWLVLHSVWVDAALLVLVAIIIWRHRRAEPRHRAVWKRNDERFDAFVAERTKVMQDREDLLAHVRKHGMAPRPGFRGGIPPLREEGPDDWGAGVPDGVTPQDLG